MSEHSTHRREVQRESWNFITPQRYIDATHALRIARPYVQDALDQLDDDDAEAIEGTKADLDLIDAALAKAGAA